MGNSKTTIKKLSVIPTKPDDESRVVRAVTNLLKLKHIKKISANQAILGNQQEGDTLVFIIKTQLEIKDPLSINGYIEVYSKQNKKIFEGQMVDGKRNGFGVQYDLQGNIVYEGQFMQNLYNGWGVSAFYKGEFLNGQRDGWGKYENHDKEIVYEGCWKKGNFDGVGCLNVGKNQIDEFLKQNINNPLLTSDKEHYVGQWVDGQKEGSGKLIRKNQIYSGDFVKDEYSGEGKLYSNYIWKKGKFLQGRYIK